LLDRCPAGRKSRLLATPSGTTITAIIEHGLYRHRDHRIDLEARLEPDEGEGGQRIDEALREFLDLP